MSTRRSVHNYVRSTKEEKKNQVFDIVLRHMYVLYVVLDRCIALGACRVINAGNPR